LATIFVLGFTDSSFIALTIEYASLLMGKLLYHLVTCSTFLSLTLAVYVSVVPSEKDVLLLCTSTINWIITGILMVALWIAGYPTIFIFLILKV